MLQWLFCRPIVYINTFYFIFLINVGLLSDYGYMQLK